MTPLDRAVAVVASDLSLPVLRRDVRWTGTRLRGADGREYPACVRADRLGPVVRVYVWGPGVLDVVAQGPEAEVLRDLGVQP